MLSPQTLSEADRRLLAGWAADCAERVLPIVNVPPDGQAILLDALARTRAFAAGDSTAAAEIRRRTDTVKVAGSAASPAGAAAARSVAQGAAVAHMGAHALGAAAYALRAVALRHSHDPAAVEQELGWQVGRLSADQRRALCQLPSAGTDGAGPLGPGLLTRGAVGGYVRRLQQEISPYPPPQ